MYNTKSHLDLSILLEVEKMVTSASGAIDEKMLSTMIEGGRDAVLSMANAGVVHVPPALILVYFDANISDGKVESDVLSVSISEKLEDRREMFRNLGYSITESGRFPLAIMLVVECLMASVAVKRSQTKDIPKVGDLSKEQLLEMGAECEEAISMMLRTVDGREKTELLGIERDRNKRMTVKPFRKVRDDEEVELENGDVRSFFIGAREAMAEIASGAKEYDENKSKNAVSEIEELVRRGFGWADGGPAEGKVM